jgi:hypothetical protein
MIEICCGDRGQREQYRQQSYKFGVNISGRFYIFEVDECWTLSAFYPVREIGMIAVFTKEPATLALVTPFDAPVVAVSADVVPVAA